MKKEIRWGKGTGKEIEVGEAKGKDGERTGKEKRLRWKKVRRGMRWGKG